MASEPIEGLMEAAVNRSAVVIGHEGAFYAWLQAAGVSDRVIAERKRIAGRSVYLIPACHDSDEIDEVVADLFEEIFRRELAKWHGDEELWPDTGDADLFARWFTVDGYPLVEDVGRGSIAEESSRGP